MKLAGLAMVVMWAGVTPTAAADSWEQFDYTLHCSGCHRADGTGSELVPSLYRIAEVFNAKDARAYLVRVPGVAQAPLSDQRLANLLNWLVERFVGRSPSPAYSPKEVGTLRESPFRDPLAARSLLLRARERR